MQPRALPRLIRSSAYSNETETDPALRVARKITPCGVAGFDKGITIACIPRLAWRDFVQQRGLRTKREQALAQNCMNNLPGEILEIIEVSAGDAVNDGPIDGFIVMNGKVAEADGPS